MEIDEICSTYLAKSTLNSFIIFKKILLYSAGIGDRLG